MTTKTTALAGLLCASLCATAGLAEALTIDSFSCPVAPAQMVQDALHGGPTSATQTDLSCVLGAGDRELILTSVTGTSLAPNRGARGEVSGGYLDHVNDAGVNSILTVNWSDFGITDLTEGGVNTSFGVMVSFVDLLSSITINVKDSLANTKSFTTNVSSPGLVLLPFASFIGTANLSQAQSIQMILSSGAGRDISIDYVNAGVPVPEPASFMLLGLGLLGVGYKRFRKA